MFSQRLRESVDKISEFLSIIVFRSTTLSVLLERFKARSESSMLFDIAGYQSRRIGNLLDVREEILFFSIVMVVHRFGPTLAIRQEVLDSLEIVVGDVGSLEVDGIQAADDAIVCKRHLRCDVVRCMGVLEESDQRCAASLARKAEIRTSVEKGLVRMRGYG